MSVRRSVGFATLFALLACGAATGSAASGQFDGAYAGTAVVSPGSNHAVCSNYPTSITIANDQLIFVSYGGHATIKTTVSPDGSFSGSGRHLMYRNGAVQTLVGKVVGNVIEADTEHPACKFHLYLKQTG